MATLSSPLDLFMSESLISAIICTHNREAYLGAAIDTALAQDFASFEVLVIDNGSTDRTKDIVAARSQDPRLRYIYEPVLGLSVARNTGAREARSAILAYLDDDAEASPQWLKTLYQAYQENEKLAIAGGRVTLLWPEGMEQPNWLSMDLASNLGIYNLGEQVVYIENPGLTPRGLNYSIRRTFLEQVGGFDPNLGRVGKNLLSNEEVYMTQRALELGWQVAYLPDALVAHNVAPERTKRSWFLNRSWWQGISVCYQEQISGQAGPGQLLRGGERVVRGLYKALKGWKDPAQSFENLAYAYGQVSYLGMAIRGMLLPEQSARRS